MPRTGQRPIDRIVVPVQPGIGSPEDELRHPAFVSDIRKVPTHLQELAPPALDHRRQLQSFAAQGEFKFDLPAGRHAVGPIDDQCAAAEREVVAVALDGAAIRQPGHNRKPCPDAGAIADLPRLPSDRDGRKHDEKAERYPDRVQQQRLELQPVGVLYQQAEQPTPETHDQDAAQDQVRVNGRHVEIAAAEQTALVGDVELPAAWAEHRHDGDTHQKQRQHRFVDLAPERMPPIPQDACVGRRPSGKDAAGRRQ